MEQTFEETQREWALEQITKLTEKNRRLHEKISKLKYELHMSKAQVKFQDGIISEYEKLNGKK